MQEKVFCNDMVMDKMVHTKKRVKMVVVKASNGVKWSKTDRDIMYR